jgi:hypothetical protein
MPRPAAAVPHPAALAVLLAAILAAGAPVAARAQPAPAGPAAPSPAAAAPTALAPAAPAAGEPGATLGDGAATPPPAEGDGPFYKQAWFWSVVGVVVVTAVIVGFSASQQGPPTPSTDLGNMRAF